MAKSIRLFPYIIQTEVSKTMTKLQRIMAKFVHQNADYRDQHGKVQRLSIAGLNTKQGRQLALGFQFFDPTNNAQLYVKHGKYCLYFARVALSRARAVFPLRSEVNDQTHQLWVNTCLEKITGVDPVTMVEVWPRPSRITLYTFPVDHRGNVQTNREFVIARFPTKGYQWREEVSRVIDGKHGVRHDVFGMHSDLDMIRSRPQLAFEVVHTHLLDTPTLQRLKKLSLLVPLIVVIVPVLGAAAKYYLRFEQVGSTLKIRCAVFIADGQVYFNNVPYPISTQEELRARGALMPVRMF